MRQVEWHVKSMENVQNQGSNHAGNTFTSSTTATVSGVVPGDVHGSSDGVKVNAHEFSDHPLSPQEAYPTCQQERMPVFVSNARRRSRASVDTHRATW